MGAALQDCETVRRHAYASVLKHGEAVAGASLVALSEIGGFGKYAGNVERDLQKLLIREDEVVPVPEPSYIPLVVKHPRALGATEMQLPILTPHEWLAPLRAGGEQ
eukprot:3542402-Pyramimonas_sp.AAC.1